MRRALNFLFAICAVGNFIWVAQDWYAGAPATKFVWISSLFFSAGVFLQTLPLALWPEEGQ